VRPLPQTLKSLERSSAVNCSRQKASRGGGARGFGTAAMRQLWLCGKISWQNREGRASRNHCASSKNALSVERGRLLAGCEHSWRLRAPFGLCFDGGSHASPASGVAMHHSQLQKPVGCYRTLSGSFEKITVKRT
jgi:hypothetical protein